MAETLQEQVAKMLSEQEQIAVAQTFGAEVSPEQGVETFRRIFFNTEPDSVVGNEAVKDGLKFRVYGNWVTVILRCARCGQEGESMPIWSPLNLAHLLEEHKAGVAYIDHVCPAAPVVGLNLGGVRVKTASVVYERKIPLGQYESLRAECSLWADLADAGNTHEAMARLWEMARRNVQQQLWLHNAKLKAKAEELFLGLPEQTRKDVKEGTDANSGTDGSGKSGAANAGQAPQG